ncbi:lanthionine synthetase LanC family protein [Kordia algicida OT-1]|uniref:Lantibiotic biosynthesis protein n=1 Tax=Kordia algicida OT-1 TaxID=391587 RepID=A9DWM4_9FLAO|nr:lanthionine synthetase LanC family protein [Kordia algicida]EDP95918.1 lantibiotic biosynthesis protein [Kordia algicida OT-1]
MKEKIHLHLESIDFFIKSFDNKSITINSGLPGIIIFYFHLHEVTKETRHYDSAIHYLEILYDQLENDLPDSYLFSSGLAGIGWFFNYIRRFVEIENAFDTAEFDITFMEVAKNELKRKNYEFISGFSGILLYILSKENTDIQLLQTFVDDVHEDIFKLEDPISFFEQKDTRHEFPSINFGVSHGMYGFVAVLNKLFARQINPKKCEAILRLIINFTFKHKKDFITNGSFFPNRIGKTINQSNHNRLAWCYGDLGILTVLYTTSFLLKDIVLQKEVTTMLIHTTHRKDMEVLMMNDVWLCHGTSGAAHIFQRLYITTQIDDFKFAANYWYSKTLQQLDRGTPQIKSNHTQIGSYARKDVTGFLLGYAGLGLSLLSKLQTTTLDWDEMLLMS